VNLLRRGAYKFSVRVAGSVKVTVDGKVALEGASVGEPKTIFGEALELTPGHWSLEIDFRRAAGPAVLQVFWEAKSFKPEPLPAGVLNHQTRALTAAVQAGDDSDRGRFVIEEYSCLGCHKAAGDRSLTAVKPRVAAELNRVGEVTNANWVYHWLGNPQAYRPGTAMPHAFADDEAGRTERAVAAHYLVSLAKPPTSKVQLPGPKDGGASARGAALIETVGCAVCHNAPEGKKPPVPVVGVGSKFEPAALARFLANPGGHNPHTRMPNMLLQSKEIGDIAVFLSRNDRLPAFEQPAPEIGPRELAGTYQRLAPEENPAVFARLTPAQQLSTVGRKLVEARNCLGCHTLKEGGKTAPAPTIRPFAEVAGAIKDANPRGCLNPTDSGKAPRFTISDRDRAAVRAFVAGGADGAGSPAPTYHAEVALHRLNCLACHQRHRVGGLTLENLESLRKFEKAENAEAVMPPALTQVGYKLKLPWLREVLLNQRRIRPWMALHMPQFANVHLEQLAEALTAADGIRPEDAEPGLPFNAQHVTDGRKLVGKAGFSCISCHDIAGNVSSGTRGPDMATVPQRIRREWYERWMWDPQRMAAGTRMPTVHVDGTSGQREILAGRLDEQVAAMWQYLSLGANLPLPEGLEAPKGLTLVARDKYIVERTFLSDAGGRGIAVGFPGGLSLAFDANNARLSYGWTGGFLDMTPVWSGRGGNPARVIGPRFWTGPAGFPWYFAGSAAAPPNWSAYTKDPAYNQPSWEGDVAGRVRKVHFDGYALGREAPTFRYHVEPPDGGSVTIRETLSPLIGSSSVGVGREFEVTASAGKVGWLLLGDSTGLPRIIDAGGDVKLDAAADVLEHPAAGRPIVLTAADRVIVIAPRTVPGEAAWVITKTGTGNARQVSLRLSTANNAPTKVRVDVLVPYRNDPAIIEQTIKAAVGR
jgi:mono/diheme cytochrome c family protein